MATTTRSQLQGFKELDIVLKAMPGRLAERELTAGRMTEVLFSLDAAGRWRLAYDDLQWIVQHKTQAARPGNSHGIRDSGWRGTDYVGLEKRALCRCIRERGINLTPEAAARLDAMPEKFRDFLAERDDLAPSADSRRAA